MLQHCPKPLAPVRRNSVFKLTKNETGYSTGQGHEVKASLILKSEISRILLYTCTVRYLSTWNAEILNTVELRWLEH